MNREKKSEIGGVDLDLELAEAKVIDEVSDEELELMQGGHTRWGWDDFWTRG